MIYRILYFTPFVLGSVLYVFLGFVFSFGSIHPLAWIVLIMLFISGMLMTKKKWWGSILGMIVGIFFIKMGSRETGQIFKETTVGVIVCVYYAIVAMITYGQRCRSRW